MNLRLQGTRGECDTAVKALRTTLILRNVSRWYPDRGSTVTGRVYIDADIPPAPASAPLRRRSNVLDLNDNGRRAA